MTTVSPYLGFAGGKCREAMTFYQQCFGGELDIKPFAGSPMENESNKEHIMHCTLNLNGKPFVMASDGCGGVEGDAAKASAAISLSVNFESEADIDAAFAKLSEGGKVTMPLERQFWGAKFGQITDKFGFPWMLHFQETTTDSEQPSKKAKASV